MFRRFRNEISSILAIGILVLASAGLTAAQQMTIRAVAHGTSTQLGKIVNVDIYIEQFSDQQEKAALLEAFMSNGSEGLSNALDKLRAKGRIALTGTIGYDLNYIRMFDLPDGGQLIRFVTDRPVRFGEAWASSRSMDYNITMGEIRIPKDGKKITGVLLPAVWPKLDKKGELELELHQNPWELSNMKIYKK